MATLIVLVSLPYKTNAYDDGKIWNQSGIIQVFIDVESIELVGHPDLYSWTVSLDRVPMQHDPHQATLWIGSYPVDLDWEREKRRLWRSSGSINLPVDIVDGQTNDPHNKGTPATTLVVLSLWLGPKQKRHSGEPSSAQAILARRMVTLRSQQPVATVSLIARSAARVVLPTTTWSVSTVLLTIGKAALLFVFGVIAWGAWLNRRENIEARHQAHDAEIQHHDALANLGDLRHRHDVVDCPSPTLRQPPCPPRVTPNSRNVEWEAEGSTLSRYTNSEDEDCRLLAHNDFCAQEVNRARFAPSRRTVRFQDEVMGPPAADNRRYVFPEHDWTTSHEERNVARISHSAAPDQGGELQGSRESTLFSEAFGNSSVTGASTNHTANLSTARKSPTCGLPRYNIRSYQQECNGTSVNGADLWSKYVGAAPDGKAATTYSNSQVEATGTADHLPVHTSNEPKEDPTQTNGKRAAYNADRQPEETQASVEFKRNKPRELENVCENQRTGEPGAHPIAVETGCNRHTCTPPPDGQDTSEKKDLFQPERKKNVEIVQAAQESDVAAQISGPCPMRGPGESLTVSDETSTGGRPVGLLYEETSDMCQIGGYPKTASESRPEATAQIYGPTPQGQSSHKPLQNTPSPGVGHVRLSGRKRNLEETLTAAERSDPHHGTASNQDTGGIGAASQRGESAVDADLQINYAENSVAISHMSAPSLKEVGGLSGRDPRVHVARTKCETGVAPTCTLLQAGKKEWGEEKMGTDEQVRALGTSMVNVPALPVLQEGNGAEKTSFSCNPEKTDKRHDGSRITKIARNRALAIHQPNNDADESLGSPVSHVQAQIDGDLHGKRSCDPSMNKMIRTGRAEDSTDGSAGRSSDRRAKHPKEPNQANGNEASGLHSAAKLNSEFASRTNKMEETEEQEGPLLKGGRSETKVAHDISSPKPRLPANVHKAALEEAMDVSKEGTIEGRQNPQGTSNPEPSLQGKAKNVTDPDDASKPSRGHSKFASEDQQYFQAKYSESSLEISHDNEESLAEDGLSEIPLQEEEKRFHQQDSEKHHDARGIDGRTSEEPTVEEESKGPITSTPAALEDSCTIGSDSKALSSTVEMPGARDCAGQRAVLTAGQGIPGTKEWLRPISSAFVRAEATAGASLPERHIELKEAKDATFTPRLEISGEKAATAAHGMESPSPIPDDGYNSQVSYVSTLPPHSDCTPTPETIANLPCPSLKGPTILSPNEHALLDFDTPHREDAEGKRRKQKKGRQTLNSFKSKGKPVQPDMSQNSPPQQFRTPVPSRKDADGDDSVQFVKAIRLTDPVPDAPLSCSLKSVAKKLGRRKMWQFDGGDRKRTTVPKVVAGKRRNREASSSTKHTVSKRVKTKSQRTLFSKK